MNRPDWYDSNYRQGSFYNLEEGKDYEVYEVEGWSDILRRSPLELFEFLTFEATKTFAKDNCFGKPSTKFHKSVKKTAPSWMKSNRDYHAEEREKNNDAMWLVATSPEYFNTYKSEGYRLFGLAGQGVPTGKVMFVVSPEEGDFTFYDANDEETHLPEQVEEAICKTLSDIGVVAETC